MHVSAKFKFSLLILFYYIFNNPHHSFKSQLHIFTLTAKRTFDSISISTYLCISCVFLTLWTNLNYATVHFKVHPFVNKGWGFKLKCKGIPIVIAAVTQCRGREQNVHFHTICLDATLLPSPLDCSLFTDFTHHSLCMRPPRSLLLWLLLSTLCYAGSGHVTIYYVALQRSVGKGTKGEIYPNDISDCCLVFSL